MLLGVQTGKLELLDHDLVDRADVVAADVCAGGACDEAGEGQAVVVGKAEDGARGVGELEGFVVVVAGVVPGHEERVGDEVGAVVLEGGGEEAVYVLAGLEVVEGGGRAAGCGVVGEVVDGGDSLVEDCLDDLAVVGGLFVGEGGLQEGV